ncbi:MAG TPA: FtsX-like permease family protein [Cyclobacteriaceae bacterium]|nr:FtsX-like permease family protein [Cyclobacteriaceae bacterium]
MKLPLFIAGRYLFSKRKKNFINIISIISVLVVAIITAALIIVLSVFNGLEELLRSLNNSFDPPLKVEAVAGKSFEVTDALRDKIKAIEGVDVVTEVVEDFAYVRYRDANQLVMLKGVSENFIEQQRIDENIVIGDVALHRDGVPLAIVGMGIRNTLSIDVGETLHAMHVYYIRNTQSATIDPSRLYTQKRIYPGAVFSIIQNLDDNYVIVPLDFAVDLLDYGDRRTSLEVKVTNEGLTNRVQAQLQQVLGDGFRVLNREQQHKDLYKLLRMEKLFAFLALALLLCIGSINIFFTLMMLALDKKRDVSILAAMGAQLKTIRNIFLLEGGLIAIMGTMLGLAIGSALCILQRNYGLVSMGMESAVMEGYPVKLVFHDILYVVITMCIITFFISYRPATLATRFSSVQHL